MKKMLCLMIGTLSVIACAQNVQQPAAVASYPQPDPAYYSDWDSAIRYAQYVRQVPDEN